MKQNWSNRTLFHGDNLLFLRAMNSESVDLIATDPPFNKGKDFHAIPDSLAKGAKFQDRWSWERDVHQDWIDQLTDDYPRLIEAIESARYAHSDGMGAYMCFMAVRLLEMHRLLKPTGSIYLHCDPTASHYLKAVMDAIFGYRNFINEIVWKRQTSNNAVTRCYGRIVDYLLFYTKSEGYVWNQTYHTRSEAELKEYRRDADGRLYKCNDLTAPSTLPDRQFTWRGVKPSASRSWTKSKNELEIMLANGEIELRSDGTAKLRGWKRYLDEAAIGQKAQTIWLDINRVGNTANERIGYPTQKPMALYERIVMASSNNGDVVLDPFAGCATTCVVAERLGRQWVGIDIWERAHDVVIERLKTEGLLGEFGKSESHLAFGDIYYLTDPPERTDGGDIAAPFLRVTERRKRPPLEAWQKLSRAEIVQELEDAQSISDGMVLCAGCGRALEAPFMELDHIQPRSDRGENDISNRILLCRPCNGRKSAKLTMKGLISENRKTGWMKNERLAIHARDLAHERYEDIRYGRRKLQGETVPDLFG